jgi:hypothetical protein
MSVLGIPRNYCVKATGSYKNLEKYLLKKAL